MRLLILHLICAENIKTEVITNSRAPPGGKVLAQSQE